METEKIEIADICIRLEKLARSDVFPRSDGGCLLASGFAAHEISGGGYCLAQAHPSAHPIIAPSLRNSCRF